MPGDDATEPVNLADARRTHLTESVYTDMRVHMSKKSSAAIPRVTMREFRAAPAKVLRRAARKGTKLRIGAFVVAVAEAEVEEATPSLYGCMAATGDVVGDPRGLLSAEDPWSTDE